MKRFALPLILAGLPLAQALEVIPAPVDHVFVPAGFDNNDNIELVVTGRFPSTCYSRNKVEVKVVNDVIDVKVTSFTTRNTRDNCLTMAVPFTEVVTVGNLQAGNYRIAVNARTATPLRDRLTVSESRSNSMDDFIYAQVDYVDLGFAGGQSGSAWLRAQLPSPCLAFDRVEYLSNGKDVISIMPIMKRLSDFCPMKMVPYEIPVRYDISNMTAKKVLLFSRSIDGKSVSTVVNRD
jgi:hypothetical protein